MHYYQFKSPTILKVSGPDAVRYMNARLTNDYKTLPIGQANLAAALTPQGKTEGFFSVCRLAEDAFLLTCDGGDTETVFAAFLRFKVADRVEVENLSSTSFLLHILKVEANILSEIINLNSIPESEMTFISTDELSLLKRTRLIEPGFDIIVRTDDSKTLEAKLTDKGISKLTESTFELMRLRAGVPSFPQEINEKVNFSESRITSAISRTKGCYVGQEVVERTDALGKAPRLLVSLQTFEPTNAGDDVYSEKEGEKIKVGSVTTAAFDDDIKKGYVFARIKNDEQILTSKLFIAEHLAELMK